MPEVHFYPLNSTKVLKFVVIAAQSGGQWIWCRHRDRITWEMPGGHSEPREEPRSAALRELREETGAAQCMDLSADSADAAGKDREGHNLNTTKHPPQKWEMLSLFYAVYFTQ